MIGKPYLQKCKWVDRDNIPANGTECPATRQNTTDYACFFGDSQLCPEAYTTREKPHPTTQCTCDSSVWTCTDWACPEPGYYKCPKMNHTLTTTKCYGNFTGCDVGTETCCGATRAMQTVSTTGSP